MAAIIWTDVTAVAPELSAVAVAAQTMFLLYVNTRLAVDLFDGEAGITTKLARIYLAAHFGKMAIQGGDAIAGPVVSESAGGLSRSYALLTSAATGGALTGSAYAGLYNDLVASSFGRLPMVL